MTDVRSRQCSRRPYTTDSSSDSRSWVRRESVHLAALLVNSTSAPFSWHGIQAPPHCDRPYLSDFRYANRTSNRHRNCSTFVSTLSVHLPRRSICLQCGCLRVTPVDAPHSQAQCIQPTTMARISFANASLVQRERPYRHLLRGGKTSFSIALARLPRTMRVISMFGLSAYTILPFVVHWTMLA